MKITIICIGRIKEKFYNDAISEYAKRLTPYTDLKIRELNDENDVELNSRAILKELSKDNRSYDIALNIGGREYDSLSFADKIESLKVSGVSHITFVIGGSDGFSDEVTKKCNESLSFSRFTFPYQLMRLILTEQIYRAFKISSGEPYHK